MESILYYMAMVVARIHNTIFSLNNAYEYYFTDKQLHFIVMGALGMIMIFILYPVFKWLAETGHIMIVTFLYVFTVVIVLCFAIEIGQRLTGTGAMEAGDISYGLAGFLIMFVIFAAIRGIYHIIKKAFDRD